MYISTLADVIEAIGPQINDILFDSTCLSRIRSIGERCPSKASDFMGFERVLGFDDSGVDFAFGLSHHGMSWLISSGLWPELRQPLSEISPYISPTSPRPWIEFDTRRGDATITQPSLHIGLDPFLNANGVATIDVAQALGYDRRVLGDRGWECIEATPSSASRVFIGKMYSRPSAGVRINIAGVGAAEVLAYLEQIRWPGNRNVVEAALAAVATPDRRFGVQVDVSEDVDSWLGLELMLNEPYPSFGANETDLQLLDDLCTAKRCTRNEQNALLCWPARIEFTAPFLDRYIDARLPKPGQRLRHGSLITALHHYKLSFKRDGSIETKVYFGVYIEVG